MWELSFLSEGLRLGRFYSNPNYAIDYAALRSQIERSAMKMKNILTSFILFFALIANSALAEGTNPVVVMKTNKGDITLELFPEQAPETVKNFLKYVDNGFYEGTIFHRVIAGFMIQGGGFTVDMKRKQVSDPVKNESNNGLSNKQGTIAMARTMHPHSATSQFFINVVNNPMLDAQGNRFGYTVFGRVTEGMDLAIQISRSAKTAKAGHKDVPKSPIIIEKIERVTPAES